jgi:hypothetical protein
MHTFTFICPQLTRLVVFAPDQESAVQSYAVWFDMRHGSFPETYCLDAWQAPEGHSQAHLDVALADGITGVGHYDPEAGWIVLPAAQLLPSERGSIDV